STAPVSRIARASPDALRSGRVRARRRLSGALASALEAAPTADRDLATSPEASGFPPGVPGGRGGRPSQRPLLPAGRGFLPDESAGNRARPIRLRTDDLRRAAGDDRCEQRDRSARGRGAT